MTDYHPLIARAVDGLEKNTGETRRALYERARAALVAQLRAVQPALSESEITKERLGLEEAIRKIEAEAARKLRAAEPRMSARAESRLRPTSAAPRERPIAPAHEPFRAKRVELDWPQHGEQPGTGEAPFAPPPTARDRLLSGRNRPPAQDQSLAQEGVRGFRDVVSEVRDLGRAAAKAAQHARTTRDSYGAAPLQRPPDETEEPPAKDHFEPHLDSDEFNDAGYDSQPKHGLEPSYEFEDEHPAAAARPRPPRAAAAEEEFRELRPPRSYRGVVQLAVVGIVLLGVLVFLSWQWSNIAGLYSLFAHREPRPAAQATQQAPAQPKFDGRVPQQSAAEEAPPAVAGGGTAPAAMVAQRVVLYEEDPNDPQGKRYVGSAVWRTETVSPGPGLAPELAVRADVTIPEKRMTMTWSLQRNTDKTLPASHTIQIMFTLPPDFPGGGIGNVPGVLMKEAEQARGTPLAGLAVKVTNGYFLIGLSAVQTDMERNMQLLKDRNWFDIPIVYTNGGRAILAMEKGPPGQRAFAEAFAAWAKK